MTDVTARRPTVELAGVQVDVIGEADAVTLIVDAARSGRGGRVTTPNLSILRQASASPDLADLVNSADLVVADGAPLVWSARLAGTPLPERVAGSSLAPALVAPAAAAGVGLLLLGGSPGCAEAAATRLASVPGLRVAHHCPPFGFEGDPAASAAIDAVVDDFAAAGPGICLVGLGFPRQDLLAARLQGRQPGLWYLGIGATIDFMAGRVSRAPGWMQRSGLEWAHRLALEPRRLGGRYARDAVFGTRLLAASARARRRARP